MGRLFEIYIYIYIFCGFSLCGWVDIYASERGSLYGEREGELVGFWNALLYPYLLALSMPFIPYVVQLRSSNIIYLSKK